MTAQDLPVVNATLNATATVLLLLGFTFIKLGLKKAHIATMITALVVSGAFLACYLYYHYNVGHVKFAGTGFIKIFYYTLLISHVFLAIVNLPMIIMTVVPAISQKFDKHKRMAKWTFPIWLYVSVTGVIVYMMCYQWWGGSVGCWVCHHDQRLFCHQYGWLGHCVLPVDKRSGNQASSDRGQHEWRANRGQEVGKGR